MIRPVLTAAMQLAGRVAAVAVWLAVGTGVIAIGVALLVAALYLRRSPWLDQLTAAPAPAAHDPVRVQIEGSFTCLRGDQVIFRAQIQGPAGAPVWKLSPSRANALVVKEDGRTVLFRSLEPGKYTLTCSVAGDGRTVASASWDFENLAFTEPDDEPPAIEESEGPPEPQGMHAQAMQPAPVPTVAEMAAEALATVQSPDRAAEARIIAGSFQAVANRCAAGLVAPDVDPFQLAAAESRAAIGPDKFDEWALFFAAVGSIAVALRSQGDVTTAASAIPTLSEIAQVLLTAR